MLERLRATQLAMRTRDYGNDSNDRPNKILALEKPQAIARLDNIFDNQTTSQSSRPSVEEVERRRSSPPHDQHGPDDRTLHLHPNSNRCGCASDSPQTVLLPTLPETKFCSPYPIRPSNILRS